MNDWKSYFCGLLTGFCLFLLLGAATPNNFTFGKYQISSSGPGNAWVINTQNGEVYRVDSVGGVKIKDRTKLLYEDHGSMQNERLK